MNIQEKTSQMGYSAKPSRADLLYLAAAALFWLLSFALLFGSQGLQARVAEVPDRVPVLIAFSENPGPSEEALVRGLGGTIKYTYHLVPAIAAKMPPKALEALQNNPRVTRIEPDGQIHAVDTELDNSWGVKRIGAGIVHTGGNFGTGVAVAVIDSGVDYTHPELDLNYMGGYNFVNPDNADDPLDDNGHGTHVAGTVAAVDDVDDNNGVVGAAPEAILYALKILDASGSGDWSDAIAALQWCVEKGCQVTNNSYSDSKDPGKTVQEAFDNAAAAGILHVAAAGNSTHPWFSCNSVGYPAKFASVIAVAATDDTDSWAGFSCTGSEVELAAPGVDINSTLPGNDYGSKSGTSMAAPHVAGTAALVIAAGVVDIDEVRTCLQNTADYLGSASKFGFGLVDADEAVNCGGSIPPDETAPAAPTGLEALGGDSQVSLNWDNNTEPDLAGYNVYRSTTPGPGYSKINTSLVTENAYIDSSVSNDTTYYYVVTAVDTSGNESTYSIEESATPQSSIPDTEAPSAPANFTATGGDSQVSLNWDNNSESDLAGYNVYRRTTSTSDYTKINGDILVTVSDYTDSSVSNGTTYYYVVTAVDTSDNESIYSDEASATPQSSGSSGALYTIDLDSRSINNGSTWTAEVTIQVLDSSGSVANVSVAGHWNTDEPTSCGPSPCTVKKSGIRKRIGSVTFTVDRVFDGIDFDGETSITVFKP